MPVDAAVRVPPLGQFLRRRRALRAKLAQPDEPPKPKRWRPKPHALVAAAAGHTSRYAGVPMASASKGMQVCAHIRQHHLFFLEANANGAKALTMDEFYAGLPDHIKSEYTARQIQGWFDMIDSVSYTHLRAHETYSYLV